MSGVRIRVYRDGRCVGLFSSNEWEKARAHAYAVKGRTVPRDLEWFHTAWVSWADLPGFLKAHERQKTASTVMVLRATDWGVRLSSFDATYV